MDLRTLGTLRDPLTSGVLEIEKGSIGIQRPRLLLEDLDLKIGLDQKQLNIMNLNGLLNGGRIQGSGSASIEQRKLATMKIDVTGQDVFLEFPPGVRSSSNLKFEVRNVESEIIIGGEVNVREGSYVEPFDFSAVGATDLTGRIENLEKTKLFGLNVRCDIRVKTLQPFEINNNLAKISARVPYTRNLTASSFTVPS